MKKSSLAIMVGAAVVLLLASAVLVISQYKTTTHELEVSSLGRAATMAQLEASLESPKPVTVERIVAANWQVPLAGLLNLQHERAKAAQLKDRIEPIKVFSFLLRHPKHGVFMIDTGVAQAFKVNPRQFDVPSFVEPMLGLDALEIVQPTEQILAKLAQPLAGVFMTHLHLDHISGLADIPKNVPVYVGINEASSTYWMNAATQAVVDNLLAGRAPLLEWRAEIVDIFGDGSVFAWHLPGHTPGSTAYLVNSEQGAQLIVGDIAHTRWGWDNSVEPGDFSQDKQRNRASLLILKDFINKHHNVTVHLGHQD